MTPDGDLCHGGHVAQREVPDDIWLEAEASKGGRGNV